MPRHAKGPRLWLRRARRTQDGQVSHEASYYILDKGRQIGVGSSDLAAAEQALAAYLEEKHRIEIASKVRDLDRIPVADVIAVYATDVAKHHARPDYTKMRLDRILSFFGDKMLVQVNGRLCRDYAAASSTDTMARRDLEELRAAINHHRKEGLHDRIVSVVLPPSRPPRERWLDRREAAALLRRAIRRPRCRHIARFILVALYTGRRAAVVCGASFKREKGRPWIDTQAGFLWPPERARITRKRNPPIPLPERLLTHLRIWQRQGARYVVEWARKPVNAGSVSKTMKLIAIEAGLGDDVTPHALRHTAATWQMQAGTDLLAAGRYLGMTTRTLETVYAHHRPEHLSAARDAYARNRRVSLAANDSHEPKRNKVARKHTKMRDFAR